MRTLSVFDVGGEMQPMVNGQPGPDESWEELAEHSLTHDDLLPPVTAVTQSEAA